MLAVLATGPIAQIAWRFLRLCGLLVFALATLTHLMSLRDAGWTEFGRSPWSWLGGGLLALSAAVITMIAPLARRIPRFFMICGLLGGMGGLVAACVEASNGAWLGANPPLSASILTALSLTLGALVLGNITVAWLLGHAYLTATRMTLAPLRYFSRMLSWAIALRMAFTVASVVLAGMGGDRTPSLISELVNQWLVVTLRVGLGLVALGVFAYWVSDCVRLRATQSATGILYFGSVFAYVGELASQHLTAQCHWPL